VGRADGGEDDDDDDDDADNNGDRGSRVTGEEVGNNTGGTEGRTEGEGFPSEGERMSERKVEGMRYRGDSWFEVYGENDAPSSSSSFETFSELVLTLYFSILLVSFTYKKKKIK
jgi:hypothetical protein